MFIWGKTKHICPYTRLDVEIKPGEKAETLVLIDAKELNQICTPLNLALAELRQQSIAISKGHSLPARF
jgi:hypothetical protein